MRELSVAEQRYKAVLAVIADGREAHLIRRFILLPMPSGGGSELTRRWSPGAPECGRRPPGMIRRPPLCRPTSQGTHVVVASYRGAMAFATLTVGPPR